MEEENCAICKGLKEDTTAHAIALEKATRAATKKANQLATAEKRPTGVAWIDAYMMYYRAVFEHEYRRHVYVENERVLDRLLKGLGATSEVCCYHSENVGWMDDGFHEETQKGLRKAFAESKWPRPLQYNEKGHIGPC